MKNKFTHIGVGHDGQAAAVNMPDHVARLEAENTELRRLVREASGLLLERPAHWHAKWQYEAKPYLEGADALDKLTGAKP